MSEAARPVAVVTGAANGIGRAIAFRLASSGWSLVGVDRESAALEKVLGELGGIAVTGDVRDTDVLTAARAAAEDAGELRAWVSNAGINRVAPLHLMDLETIDEVLDIVLRAVIVGARVALQSFLANGVAGSIVNISSIHGRGGFPGFGAYDAAKGGVEAFTRYVCVEYGHLGIRCNAIAPGAVNTAIGSGPGASRTMAAPDAPSAAELAPMRRTSEPDEIAEVVAFLLSGAPVSINGHTLAVDNGMSAWSSRFPPEPDVRFATAPSES